MAWTPVENQRLMLWKQQQDPKMGGEMGVRARAPPQGDGIFCEEVKGVGEFLFFFHFLFIMKYNTHRKKDIKT